MKKSGDRESAPASSRAIPRLAPAGAPAAGGGAPVHVLTLIDDREDITRVEEIIDDREGKFQVVEL